MLNVVRGLQRLPLLGALGTVMLGVAAHADDQQTSRRTRAIKFTSRPIAESLLPDDEIVTLPRLGAGGMITEIDTADEVLAAAVPYTTIALVDVTGVSPLLTSEGTIIRTQFVGSVAEVLSTGARRPSTDHVRPGQIIEFTNVGGEVAIRGVIVRADPVVDYAYPKRYLAILGAKSHENGWTMPLSPPLLLTQDTLTAVVPAASLLTGLRLEGIRAAIKKHR